ncbi:hypothetical protein EK21DRAFT_107992 [Setomelanomma holmii]|uniref:Uncharacterized protein n=1 Tax=Setomelanomma holmii TaxID=210430 RepID=A0A9P4HJY2_9PLEO|nr:hypothetical protein EK21DRAFT_107992 [Setomelanomma holmii]
MVFFTIILGLMTLLPSTRASSDHHKRDRLRRRAELRVRAVSDKVRVFAQDLNVDLAEKTNSQDQNREVLAHNLVADVVSSVCDEYFSGTRPSDFTPVVVQNCVKAIYGGERLAQPTGQFFAVLGASLLCDYVVSEAYPVAQELFPDGCEDLQDLARKITPSRSATASNVVTPTPSNIETSVATQPSQASNILASNAATPDSLQISAAVSDSASVPSNIPSQVPLSNSARVTNSPPRSGSTPSDVPSQPPVSKSVLTLKSPSSFVQSVPSSSNVPSQQPLSNPALVLSLQLQSAPAPSDIPSQPPISNSASVLNIPNPSAGSAPSPANIPSQQPLSDAVAISTATFEFSSAVEPIIPIYAREWRVSERTTSVRCNWKSKRTNTSWIRAPITFLTTSITAFHLA